MKALVVEKDLSLSIKDLPEPKIKSFEAKCKILACGICGSDKKILHGVPFTKAPPISYPLVLGHETAGEVVEIGRDVTKFRIGDIVTCPFNLEPEGYGGAWGGFAEYGTVFDGNAAGHAGEYLGPVQYLSQKQHVMPDWMDVKQIPVFTIMRETLGAVRRFGFDSDESIVVFGLGPIGLSFIRFLNVRGLKPIIAVDIIDEKVEKAKEFGADFGFNANDPDLEKKILSICPNGVNHVLDAVGIPELWNSMLPLLGENSQLAVFGLPPAREGTIKWGLLNHWNFKLTFFQMSQAPDEGWAHNQVLALVRGGVVNLSDYISDYFPFREIVPVLKRFLNNEFKLKTIITF